MIKIIFIVVMLPFIVIVVGTNNTYAQFDIPRKTRKYSGSSKHDR